MARILAILTLICAVAFAAVPIFTEPFTGFAPEQLPNPVSNLPVQPAGYAFALWGAIYLWLIAGAGFGVLKRGDDPAWQKMRPALIVSMAIGAVWIPVALRAPVPATLLIIAMLVFAVIALLRAPRGDVAWGAGPIGLYAGWLTAASCVATSTVAVGYGIGTPNSASWVALGVALVIATAITRRADVPLSYPVAGIWALIGITWANWNIYPAFATAACLGALLLVALGLGKTRASA